MNCHTFVYACLSKLMYWMNWSYIHMCMIASSVFIEWSVVAQFFSLCRGKGAALIFSCVVQGERCCESGHQAMSEHCAYVLNSSLRYFASLESLVGVPKRV